MLLLKARKTFQLDNTSLAFLFLPLKRNYYVILFKDKSDTFSLVPNLLEYAYLLCLMGLFDSSRIFVSCDQFVS
jgi:hypothetical protein